MKTKQTIAIIGASGELGSAIARSISKGNYRLLLHATDQDKIAALIDDMKKTNPYADIERVDNFFEACWEADIIIAAVPYDSEKLVAYNIREVVNQKIVISVSNPLNKPFNAVTIEHLSAAEELQKLLPNAKVIKAFNTVFANDFEQPVIDDQKTDCFIAGDDEDAQEAVYELVKTAGFHPVIAGDLSISRTLEDMQVLLQHLAMQKNYKRTAWKILHD